MTVDPLPVPAHLALLPNGFEDVLPQQAEHEAQVIERLIACFAGYGYARVKPPLLEFEETLFAGPGAKVAGQTFRLMDPVSQGMMGLRADITPQVARIATTRLRKAPRPLRLCYAGQVLRVSGTQLRAERQFAQAGVELIGAPSLKADAEMVLLAADALGSIGVSGLSIDLSLPPLVRDICLGLGMGAAQVDGLRDALDRKDAAAVAALAGSHQDLFGALLRAAGPAETALERLSALDMPPEASDRVQSLRAIVAEIRDTNPDLALTLDPVEHRGFEYQTGASFTLFAQGARGELGRGGRYMAPGAKGQGEPAAGFTLYMDSVLRALPHRPAPARVFIPAGMGAAGGIAALRAEGWIALRDLSETVVGEEQARAEARRLGCTHILTETGIVGLED